MPLQDSPDGLLPIADPPLLQNAFTKGRLGRGHHVDAHVGATEVIEVNSFGYGSTRLINVTYIPASIHNEAMLSGARTSIAQ